MARGLGRLKDAVVIGSVQEGLERVIGLSANRLSGGWSYHYGLVMLVK